MTGECSFDRCFGRFEITGLSHQQNVRVLAHEGAECRGEVEALFTVHLALGDARQGVFDRVFHRGDVDAWIVALGQK